MAYKPLPFALAERSRRLLTIPHPVPREIRPENFALHFLPVSTADSKEEDLFFQLRTNVCEMPRSGSSSLDRFTSYGKAWFDTERKLDYARPEVFFSSWITVHEELNNKRAVTVTCVRWESICLAVAISLLTVKVHAEELLGGNAREDVLRAAKRAAALSRHAQTLRDGWKNAPLDDDFLEVNPAFLRGLRGLCESLWWFACVSRHRPGNVFRSFMESRTYASTMLAIHDATFPDKNAEFIKKCSALPVIGAELASALQHLAKAALFEHHAVLSEYYDPAVETVTSTETSWEAAFYHQNEMYDMMDRVAGEYTDDMDVSFERALEDVKTRLVSLEMTCKSQKECETVYPPKALALDELPKANMKNIW
jgi:hypothetical protein